MGFISKISLLILSAISAIVPSSLSKPDFPTAKRLDIPIGSNFLSGFISLSETKEGVDLQLDLQLNPENQLGINLEFLKWSIHDFPFHYGDKSACRETWTRPVVFNVSTQFSLIPLALQGTVKKVEKVVYTLTNVSLTQLLGHSLLLTTHSKRPVPLACANLLSSPLDKVDIFEASFKGEKITGQITFFLFEDRLRILSKLKGKNGTESLAWSLASKWWPSDEELSSEKCSGAIKVSHPQSSLNTHFKLNFPQMVTITSGSERLDITEAILVLFSRDSNGRPSVVDCAQLIRQTAAIGSVEMNSGTTKGISLIQSSKYHTIVSDKSLLQPTASAPGGGIRETKKWYTATECSGYDMSVVKTRLGSIVDIPGQDGSFLPQQSLFGPETLLLQYLISISDPGEKSYECNMIRGIDLEYMDSLTAEFYYPVSGQLFITQYEPHLLLVYGRLHHLFDKTNSESPWKVIQGTTPDNLNGLSCSDSLHPKKQVYLKNVDSLPLLVLNAQNATEYSLERNRFILDGSLKDFVGNSIQIVIDKDYHACGNITATNNYRLKADLIRYGPNRAPKIGEILVKATSDGVTKLESSVKFSLSSDDTKFNISIHEVGINMGSSHSRHPCDPNSLGTEWVTGTRQFQTAFPAINLDGGSTIIDLNARLGRVDGKAQDWFGKSILLASSNELICGTFLPTSLELPSSSSFFLNDLERSDLNQAGVDIDGKDLWGHVKFSQRTGGNSLGIFEGTNIYVNIKSDLYQTVTMRIVPGGPDCSPNTPIYNPFFQDSSKDSYNNSCNYNSALCAIGDLQSKLKVAISTDSAQSVTVYALPLSASFSIIGKYLLVEGMSRNKKETTFLCSQITEWPRTVRRPLIVNNAKTKRRFVKMELLEQMKWDSGHHLELSYNRTNLIPSQCVLYHVHITGPSPLKLAESFDRLNLTYFLGSELCKKTGLQDYGYLLSSKSSLRKYGSSFGSSRASRSLKIRPFVTVLGFIITLLLTHSFVIPI